MAIRNDGAVRKQLRILFNFGTIGTLTDGQLLERFASGHGEMRELAFAALVERHGPFVLHICRAVLGNEHEADDAFQATFLALVRKAKYLWVQDSLGPWLHQAAYRAASHDRAARVRRRRTRQTAALNSERLEHRDHRDGLEAVIHEEVNRLPARLSDCRRSLRSARPFARRSGAAHGLRVGTVKSRSRGDARNYVGDWSDVVSRQRPALSRRVPAGSPYRPPLLRQPCVMRWPAKRQPGRSRSRSLYFHFMGNGGNS